MITFDVVLRLFVIFHLTRVSTAEPLKRKHHQPTPNTMADPKEMDEESDVEMDGIDMDGYDDEAAADDAEVDEIEAEVVDEDAAAADDVKVDEHELEELEAARKERMDLMYVRICLIFFINVCMLYFAMLMIVHVSHSLTSDFIMSTYDSNDEIQQLKQGQGASIQTERSAGKLEGF